MQMNFSLNTVAFARAVQTVKAAVADNPVVPALSNIMIVGRGTPAGASGTLHLCASNLETRLLASLPFECAENFAVLVDAKKLLDTLRGFPDAAVKCSINGKEFKMQVGKSTYKTCTEDAEAFPKGKKLDAGHRVIALPENLLHAALKSTLAVSATVLDSGRPFTNGVFVETTNHFLAFVSASDNRLCAHVIHNGTAEGDACTWSEEVGASLLPRAAAHMLFGLLDPKSTEPITLQIDSATARLSDNRWQATRMAVPFPAWQDMVTKAEFAQTLDMDRDELVAALKRLTGYAPENTQLVRFDIRSGGEVVLEADDPRYGNEGTETLHGDLSGEALTIGFPCKRILELLALYPAGPVRLSFVNDGSGAMLTNPADDELPSLTCIITAMRLVEVAA